MNSRTIKRKAETNENKKNSLLNNKYHSRINFRSLNSNNRYNRYSADLKKIRTHKYFSENKQINLNSININSTPSRTIKRIQDKNAFNSNKFNNKFFLLNNTRNLSNINSDHKSNNFPIYQINRKKLFRNNSLGEFNDLNQNKSLNLKNSRKISDVKIDNHNSKQLYEKIFPEGSPYHFFKIKNINEIIKSTMFNKRKIIPSFRSYKMNSSNYCDASTNTNCENKKMIEKKQQIQIEQKYKRPLMVDYFESEHKKFCHGFDKFKGRNKYKIPFFIVYKY